MIPNYYNYGVQPLYSTASPQLTQPFQNDLGKEVIYVNGLTGAYQCTLPPGTKSIMVIDADQPLMYLITTTDGVNRAIRTYDISEHHDNQPTPADGSANSLEESLQAISTKLSEMEGKIDELESRNGGSSAEQKPNPKYSNGKSGNGSNAGGH